MYYPIQIPYILNKEFSEYIEYFEERVANKFLICFWEMQAKTNQNKTINNIIITDGCIDLVADFADKQIGFVGMDKTNFNFEIVLPAQFLGARLKPAAFQTITGLSATVAMNNFIPLDTVDKSFDTEKFFNLPYNDAKALFKEYISGLADNKTPDIFNSLFDCLIDDIPNTTEELYRIIGYSQRHSQRLFLEKFGITAQTVLCILRFQKCLEAIIGGEASPNQVLNIVNYYDQAHMIKDFKKHIGITPLELVAKYR